MKIARTVFAMLLVATSGVLTIGASAPSGVEPSKAMSSFPELGSESGSPEPLDAVCGDDGYSCGSGPSDAICCRNNQSCCKSSTGVLYCGTNGCNRG
jgi:hypothetical protein